MSISASKRRIVILCILFVLFLLGGVTLFFKDVISNGIKHGRWFSVDKYEELLDFCEWEKNGSELSIKCNALIKSIYASEENMEDVCYEFSLFPRIRPENVRKFILCENPESIISDMGDIPLKSEPKLDLQISFKGLILKYSLHKIEMKNFKETKNTFTTNMEQELKKIGINAIITPSENAKVIKVVKDQNGSLNLSFFISERENETTYNFDVFTNGVGFVKMGEKYSEYISKESLLEKIKPDNYYKVIILYSPESISDSVSRIDNYCKSIDISNKEGLVLCANKNNILNFELLKYQSPEFVNSDNEAKGKRYSEALIYLEEL